jgi:hypothetical protein
MRNGWRRLWSGFSTDRIVSLSAMAVGVGSLFVIVYQTHLMRQAQSASALPYLMISIMSNSDGVYLMLRNAGLGPALIEHVQITYQGRTFEEDPYDFFIRQRPDRNLPGLSVDKIVPGRLLPAGDALQTLGMSGDERVRMLDDLLRLFEIVEVPRSWLTGSGITLSPKDRAVLEITYASVYGDRWRIASDRIVPQRR